MFSIRITCTHVYSYFHYAHPFTYSTVVITHSRGTEFFIIWLAACLNPITSSITSNRKLCRSADLSHKPLLQESQQTPHEIGQKYTNKQINKQYVGNLTGSMCLSGAILWPPFSIQDFWPAHPPPKVTKNKHERENCTVKLEPGDKDQNSYCWFVTLNSNTRFKQK